jgi:hypothetical protein
VQELQGLLEALAKLVTALGAGWTITILVGVAAYNAYRDYRKDKLERSIADEKEAQIQRLADDNRWMRRVLMEKVMGFSTAEAEKLISDGQPTPLLSGRDKEAR